MAHQHSPGFLAMVEAAKQQIREMTIDEYQRRTGIAATVFASRPADGARLSHPQEQGRRG